MVTAARIHPDALYDDLSLYLELGLSPGAVARARRTGRLRHSRQGKRSYYLGQWVLDWLRADGDSTDRKDVVSRRELRPIPRSG